MDCLDEILIYYKKKELQNSQAIKAWISNILVDLMRDLEEENPENYLRVRNCLVLLINLFFDVDYPDHYHSKGISAQDISEKDRIKFIEILKSEVTNFN